MSKEDDREFRTAPRVGSLKDLERYIKFLTFEIVPYTYIDGKNLLAKKQNNLITNEEYEEILEWKKQNGFSDGQTYFQDLTALSTTLEITTKEIASDEELDGYFSSTSILTRKITNDKKTHIPRLTKIGEKLSHLSEENNLREYKRILFWLILRSNFRPVWQSLFLKSDVFSNTPVREAIEEKDKETRTFFLNVSNYLDLFDFNAQENTGEIFSRLKIGLYLFYSTILEINSYEKNENIPIQQIISDLRKKFHCTNIDFLNILKIIFDMERKKENPVIEGAKESIQSLSLPEHENIQMLTFKDDLEISSYDNLNEQKVLGFIQ